MAVLGHVLDDRLDLLLLVAQRDQRARHRLVDDLHRAAADQLLELDQRQVRLDAGRVAVHHEADRAGRRQHRRLRVAPAVGRADRPGPAATPPWPALCTRHVVGVVRAHQVVGRGVLAHDALVGVRVAGVTLVRADDAGQFRRPTVGGAGHQRRDRRGQRAAAVGVVRVAGGHQQRAEVGVADAQLAELPCGVADRLGREVREADRDVHRRDDVLDGLHERAGRRTCRRHRGTSTGSATPGCSWSCPGAGTRCTGWTP